VVGGSTGHAEPKPPATNPPKKKNKKKTKKKKKNPTKKNHPPPKNTNQQNLPTKKKEQHQTKKKTQTISAGLGRDRTRRIPVDEEKRSQGGWGGGLVVWGGWLGVTRFHKKGWVGWGDQENCPILLKSKKEKKKS